MARLLIGNVRHPLINNLTTDTPGSGALDAAQGKVLEGKKIDKTNIVNNLTTTVENMVLDARQGKVLKDGQDELNRNLQVATVTPAKSGNIAGNPTIKQSGYVKMLKINTTITLNMAVGTEYILCTLAVAQRPDADYIKYLSQGRLTISALGSVTFSPTTALPSGQYIHITETFI